MLFVVILLLEIDIYIMTTSKSKDPIKLRQRKTKSGLTSLYLDIYMNGRRQYEYLKLYLIPEKSRSDKEKNRDILRLAEDVRAKRLVELRNNEFGFTQKQNGIALFYPFLDKIISTKKSKGMYISVRMHSKVYDNRENLRFRDITQDWVRGFKRYLENDAEDLRKSDGSRTKLLKNTQSRLFSLFKSVLKEADRDGIIQKDPSKNVCGISSSETKRMYLTIEEIKLLIGTECDSEDVKKAFLFSCLTGLRYSDVKRLTWGDVQKQGEFTRLVFRQKKTNGQEYLDISHQASYLMGERKGAFDKVFNLTICRRAVNERIKKWVDRAEINKHISFHCARHTFAVMMLDLDTNIYVVSKLLGHRSVATTQIYAKVLDRGKQEAISRIPNILNTEDKGGDD